MADAIGTAASVVGLIGALLKTIQEIQKARERVKNAPKRLDEISVLLQVTSQTASLVREEPRLQTPAVIHQLEILNTIAEELKQLLKKLDKKSRKHPLRKLARAVRIQDADDTELANITNRLSDAKAELGTRMLVIHVGLTGNLEDGFRVMLKVLEEINSKVFHVLGENLHLIDRLRSRGFTIVGNGAISLGPADIRSLQLEDELPSQQHLSGGSHVLNLPEFGDSGFLSNLSSIHPNLNTASQHHFGYQSSAKSFNSSRLASDLQEQKGKPFIFVDDETGLGHSMFSLSVLTPVRFDRADITAYFFCKDPQNDPISPITTSTILGGLAYVLLRYSDGPELLTRMNCTFGHELKISRAEVSRAGLFHRMLASGKLLSKEESPVVAFFSFATFEAGANQSPTSGREQMNQAQVIWCIVAQLLRGQFGPESSLAEILVRLSPTEREALNSICSAFGEPESSFKPSANGDDPASPVPETITSWYCQIRGLTRDYFSKVATVMSACLEDIRKDGKCVVLILDGLELQSQSARMRLLTWIAKLGHGVRALLCIDDTRKDSTGVESREAEVMSNALIVDETTEWRECIESLRFDGMHQRRDQVADPLPATNQWLWETEEFQEWRSSGKILWIMGKAGSGKSVLAKNIQQRLQRDVPHGDFNDDPFVCDWFYSARGPDFEAKDASMLRALTFNILSSSKTTFEPATSIYRARFDAGRQDDDWLQSELSDLFTTLALSPSTPRTLAVVDALDESESVTGPSGLKSTHQSFNLLQMFTGIASSRNSRVRFVLLSRPESVISKSLSNCLKIKMEQYNNRDISIMIEGGIEKLRVAWRDALSSDSDHDDLADFSEDPDASTDSQRYESQSPNDDLDIQEETLGKIRAYLETHANGVILWVILIIRQLLLLIEDEKLFTTQDLMDSLIASPPEVEELYIRFLEGLKGSSRSGEFYIEAARAEEMVTNQAYRYLGIRASSPGQLSCRSAAEGERDPILALELAVAPLLQESLKISLPTTRQYTKSEKRPLAKFALDVILKLDSHFMARRPVLYPNISGHEPGIVHLLLLRKGPNGGFEDFYTAEG
ncbi:hypothetical protein CTAM01_08011 [Colletotrichum tamarilloi]|uniref:Nephrocystin 3-like N-terminal domain-containing protein n=1 Tax=Colletotrichum tamarilloi TaxID=1209934 RepID=A0ABQ9R6Y4_9PEZI|nr:uncharacterized protein CTAM01_08011 [Colletotrichum tamarilloi]KAK1496999.1 hypothetical protein CTAM01_08011 [Colletotrichum tamarilloi]